MSIEEFDRMIDATTYQVIKHYINSPEHDVFQILFCNTKQNLPIFANDLSQCSEPSEIQKAITKNNASVINHERSTNNFFEQEFMLSANVLDLTSIPDSEEVCCIYLPPFYLISL